MAVLAFRAHRDTPFGARFVSGVRMVADSPEMASLRRALQISFGGLFAGLAALIAAAHGSFLHRVQVSFPAAFGTMAFLLVVVLSSELARRRNVPRAAAVLVACTAFALSLPYAGERSLTSLLGAIGSSGLFLAIGTALLTVGALAISRARYGTMLGTILSVAGVVGVAACLHLAGVSLTAALDAAIAPLGHLGDSLTALLVIVLVETLLWTIGVHGPALLAAVVLPVYVNLQLANTQALAHDRPLPHVVTISLFLFVFPGGAGATLPLVLLLLRSRVSRLRRVALATLVPTLCNANEPLMFSLPLVLDPVLAIPFVAAPLVLAVVTYQAVAHGFVSAAAYYIPSTVPLPLGAFLATRDWRAVVLVIVNVAIGTVIYAPFARAFERQEEARTAGMLVSRPSRTVA